VDFPKGNARSGRGVPPSDLPFFCQARISTIFPANKRMTRNQHDQSQTAAGIITPAAACKAHVGNGAEQLNNDENDQNKGLGAFIILLVSNIRLKIQDRR